METSQSAQSSFYIRRKPLPSSQGDRSASQVNTSLDASSVNTTRDDSVNNGSVDQAIYNLQDCTPSRDLLIADKSRERWLRSHSKTNVVRSWLWEAIASIFSLLCLASIVGVLVYEDGKQLDQWEWSLPPTAVVSFIGTLGKASLVLVLSQILSQWKWLHFTEAKPLRHMRIFDQASRGPLGSALVMWKSKGFLASVAACMMVLTILIDPFIQLVFTFPSILVLDDTQQAVFQSINMFHLDKHLIENTTTFDPSQKMWVGIYRGMFPSAGSAPSVICPSGNCVWSDVQTLGVCASCSNVTASVKVHCSNKTIDYSSDTIASKLTCHYSFPVFNTKVQAHQWLLHPKKDNNNNVTGEPYYNWLGRTLWNSTSTDQYHPGVVIDPLTNDPSLFSDYFKGSATRLEFDGKEITAGGMFNYTGNFSMPNTTFWDRNSTLYQFSAIRLPQVYSHEGQTYSNYSAKTPFPPATCWNCEFFWCEKTISNMQVSGGSTSPSVSASSGRIQFTQLALSSDSVSGWSETWFDNVSYGIPVGELDVLKSNLWTFKYRVPTFEPDFFSNFFSSFYINSDEPYSKHFSQDLVNEMSSFQADLYSNPGLLQAINLEENMDLLVSRLADGITESIRMGPDSKKVLGQVHVSRSFIHVRWPWLVLPLALMAITCILLPIVAIKSHGAQVDVWKDDPLALLFHRLDNVDLSGKTDRRDLDSLLDDMYVGLDRDTPLTFTRRLNGKI